MEKCPALEDIEETWWTTTRQKPGPYAATASLSLTFCLCLLTPSLILIPSLYSTLTALLLCSLWRFFTPVSCSVWPWRKFRWKSVRQEPTNSTSVLRAPCHLAAITCRPKESNPTPCPPFCPHPEGSLILASKLSSSEEGQVFKMQMIAHKSKALALKCSVLNLIKKK